MTAQLAFVIGFNSGRRTRRFISRKDAEIRNPRMSAEEIESYLNGHDDGVRRDFWRVTQMLPAAQRAAA